MEEVFTLLIQVVRTWNGFSPIFTSVTELGSVTAVYSTDRPWDAVDRPHRVKKPLLFSHFHVTTAGQPGLDQVDRAHRMSIGPRARSTGSSLWDVDRPRAESTK